jgi:CBS domain containing-hemolysin-like protein
MIQLILAVGLAIGISALCSIIEAVLYSVPISHVEVLSQSNTLSGRTLKEMKSNIHKPITAILTLNTIANTMGAAVAGASAVALFGNQYLAWFSALFTLAILLFSEILPKTAGVAYAKQLSTLIALPLKWLVIILAPIIWMCQMITKLIPSKDRKELFSADEIQAVAVLSRKSGGIDPQQENVIANILELKNKLVRQAMTPRTVTFSLNKDLTVGESKELKSEWDRHSRVPVYDKDPDEIVGIVLRKDVLLSFADGDEEQRLSDLMQPVHFVPESAPLNKVMMDFFERRQHLFVVVDEYGSVTGVISLEDILEEIMGREIIDESDLASDMREFARLKKRAMRRDI